jgi:inner membrane protein
VVSDLRMGQEPNYVFSFDIGPPLRAGDVQSPAQQMTYDVDVGQAFEWLGQRLLGRDVHPPGL